MSENIKGREMKQTDLLTKTSKKMFQKKKRKRYSTFEVSYRCAKVFKTLRKQAYSNILKILPPKKENSQIKTLIFFIFLLKI